MDATLAAAGRGRAGSRHGPHGPGAAREEEGRKRVITPGRLSTRYARTVQYAVTVEPDDHRAHPKASVVNSTVDAGDKDAALEAAEASYRRTHPDVGKLRLRVVRLRPRTAARPE